VVVDDTGHQRETTRIDRRMRQFGNLPDGRDASFVNRDVAEEPR